MLPKLLDSSRIRRLIGFAAIAQGVLGFLAPRKLTKVNARLWFREAFENPGDLEVTDAYAGIVRDMSLAAVLFGLLTLRRAAKDEEDAIEAELEDDADAEPEDDAEDDADDEDDD
jgi:hypothetical protein